MIFNSTGDLVQEFVLQARGDSLKTAHYPKEFKGLRMKASFGQGVPARVPWISFFTPEMSTSNGFYPVFLYYKAEKTLVLALGVSETHDFGKSWDPSITESYPTVAEVIQNPPRYGDSWAFRTYKLDDSDVPPLLYGESGLVSAAQVDEDLDEILALFSSNLEIELKDRTSSLSSGLFYMEKQLEDFIISNWELSGFGENLELLFSDDGDLVSQQYRTSIGPIDILARDRNTGDYVVIELKRNQTSDDTVGQVQRYMGWVKKELGNPGVRGIIVAGKFDKKLEYALEMVDSVDVYLYEVDFKLREHQA